MRIKEAEILNYRSCVKTKIDLHTNLTALIGVNGVGKSTILNAIRLLKQPTRNRRFYPNRNIRNRRFYSNLHTDDMLHARLNLKVELGNEVVFLRTDLFYETDERNLDDVYFSEMKFRLAVSNSRKWHKIEIELLEVVEYMNRTRTIEIPLNKRFQTEIAKTGINLLLSLSSVNYYSATQFSDPTRCPVSLELGDFRLTTQINRNNSSHEYFIHDLYWAFKDNEKSFSLFLNVVNQNGIQLIDDIKFYDHDIPSSSIKVKSGGKLQKIEKSKKIIIPTVIVDGLNLSPNQLSEGTFKSLALIFYILSDVSDILLIEEPEVCVHHGLLSSIIELIKLQSRKKQIVISTHSDYVLDQLLPENVILIKKEKGNGTEAQPLTKALSKNDYKALREYLREKGNLGEYWKEGGFENE